jgi:hypothetical protein
LAGPGAHDRYLVYGNLFFDNPHEALFQGEGNLALYNNVMLNPRGEGVRIQPHNDRPREVAVFRNTIVAAGLGLGFVGGEPGYSRSLEHNLIFGNPPLQAEVAGENVTGSYAQAAGTFARIDSDLESLDLTPTADVGRPRARLPAALRALPASQRDYAGRDRNADGYGACEPRRAASPVRCGLPASGDPVR